MTCLRPVAAQFSTFSRRLPCNRSPSRRPCSAHCLAAALSPLRTARPSLSASTHLRSLGQARSSAGRESATRPSLSVTT
ncbi:hypothetical protein [Nonomuraea dietziae]|uniref:hypothetical protein n=1 Tax=Nonomuraea dietziae TaxID=65515 RepID=UPI0031D7EC54